MKFYRFLLFILISTSSGATIFAQDSIPVSPNIKEENFLKFQDHFFKALAQKSINNYKLAIENLEKCNELQPKDVSVLFELSKNFLFLKKYLESEAFGKQALTLEPTNYWVLSHMSKLYIASRNIEKAIEIQKRLAELNPKDKRKLVYLYFQIKDLEKTRAVIAELEKEQLITPSLVKFKNLFLKTKSSKKAKDIKTLDELLEEFESNKTFDTLHKILTLSAKSNPKVLLSYSEIGLELFPAQAIVYLMNAKALNQQGKFKKAIEQLTNGIDFVIDNPKLEADFYDVFAKSYQGLGNEKEAIKHKNKALELRKKGK